MLSIQLQNTVTKQVYEFSDIEDKNNGKKLFYKFNLNLTDVPEGEYEVTLYKDGEVIKKEILKLGDFNNKSIQYSKGNNIFIEAKPEFNITSRHFDENGIYIPNDGELWNRVSVGVTHSIDCELFGYRMHNLPYEYFYTSTYGGWWGAELCFDTFNVVDFENFFINCPNLNNILIDASNATNLNNMVDAPQNIQDLWITYLGCSFSYAPYTNINHIDSINYTLFDVQEVWDKEETPIINLSKYLPMVDEDAIASAVNKGWLVGGINIFPEYSVNLNDQWRLSEEIPNPDTYSFDGVYESFSNWNVNSGTADMSIEFENKNEFTFYIRSYGESGYDFIQVFELDKAYTGNVYATTINKPNSNTDIGAYQQVTFTNIPDGKHTIYIRYRKDGSGNKGTDRGYVIIPKYQ